VPQGLDFQTWETTNISIASAAAASWPVAAWLSQEEVSKSPVEESLQAAWPASS
jgi:hypothetical protein